MLDNLKKYIEPPFLNLLCFSSRNINITLNLGDFKDFCLLETSLQEYLLKTSVLNNAKNNINNLKWH